MLFVFMHVYNEKLFDVFLFARVIFALCNGKNKKNAVICVLCMVGSFGILFNV